MSDWRRDSNKGRTDSRVLELVSSCSRSAGVESVAGLLGAVLGGAQMCFVEVFKLAKPTSWTNRVGPPPSSGRDAK
ncbi:hypothetical protein K505DRAFT_68221 [Melanomma pulvis-pyrius CBS 109.77]|uniref:Uncharacterized protein n=1 Tax=Melanomma pulvis-pyrius CBS 109.77 TaxID=1314802 RepID=A0A6A6XUX2_9PLEO|nr:hypothetical protein K505DRAFT_68221 [Melanomma pulvis-pyrius CBS 109.77]